MDEYDDLLWTPIDRMEAESRQGPDDAVARQRREQELADLRKTFRSGAGFRLLQRIVARAGVFRPSYHPSGSAMAHNEGRRDMGLWLLSELVEALPDDHHKILVAKEQTR